MAAKLTTRDRALLFVEKQIRSTRQALGRSEQKPGVTHEEIENLNIRLELLEWISAAVLSYNEEDYHEN